MNAAFASFCVYLPDLLTGYVLRVTLKMIQASDSKNEERNEENEANYKSGCVDLLGSVLNGFDPDSGLCSQ